MQPNVTLLQLRYNALCTIKVINVTLRSPNKANVPRVSNMWTHTHKYMKNVQLPPDWRKRKSDCKKEEM